MKHDENCNCNDGFFFKTFKVDNEEIWGFTVAIHAGNGNMEIIMHTEKTIFTSEREAEIGAMGFISGLNYLKQQAN